MTTIRVEGLTQLGAAMRKLSEKVNKRIAASATGAAAKVIKNAAVRKIETNPSVDTGSLRDAVIVKKLGKGESQGMTSAHITTVRYRGSKKRKSKRKQATAPYAHIVEFGSVKMQAEPFLRPAFDERKDEALRVMVDRLRAGIEKATP